MPVEISVGPPVLTINQGNTFMVTDLNGEITSGSELGVFSNDTRFVSYYKIFANGEPWVRLSSSAVTYYAARICCTNKAFSTEDGDIAEGTIALTITRQVGKGIGEHLEIVNYSAKPVRFNLEIAIRSDFADIFEVRSHKFIRRGRIETKWHSEATTLKVSYGNRDFHRCLTYKLEKYQSKPYFANGRITFEVQLEPGQVWECSGRYLCLMATESEMTNWLAAEDGSDLDKLQKIWQHHATGLHTSNEDIYRLYHQSVEDIGALRLHADDSNPDVWVPAAGVPWYVTLFGRDSLFASLQSMPVNPLFSKGALKKLAQFQATATDDWRDAQPGKILHEIRFGELAHFKRIPHTPYYGTADATPLYLIVLHEAWKWLGEEDLFHRYRDVALRCLEWIDKYGDLDGDGFQEYKTNSPLGYENMGWKDSPDSVIYPNGEIVKQPKALCELQGYVFDAWMRMSEMFQAFGDKATATELRNKAIKLQKQFEEKFWLEDVGFYAYALDPDKKPVATIASNIGHCLWSGIIDPKHADKVVQRFFQEDLWSGWGIRTLSENNPVYNPFSYHCGSVWPHDNGIIALGFKRYGFVDAAARVARDISEAASFFLSYRLPELYSGTKRKVATFPVQYPGANVPQAWAAGSVFHLIQAILGLQADVPNGRLYVDPHLPGWLPDIAFIDMKVGSAVLDLKFTRNGEVTIWDANVKQGNIEIVKNPWRPWLA